MYIISGYKKNKKIITPKRDFRPTQAKVREALFNIIDIQNKTLLDLCAGSGAIAFEALSRGARFATLVEIDREAIKSIFQNAKSIYSDEENKYKIKRIATEDFVKRTDEKFDIIYLDPPYHSKIYNNTVSTIINRELLNDNGILIVELGLDYYKNFLENYKEKLEYDVRIYGECVLVIFK